MRCLIANDWPVWLWMRLVPLSVPIAVCWQTDPLPWLFDCWYHAVLFAGILVLAWTLGWYSAALVGVPILGTVYYSQGLSNGAPVFQRRYCAYFMSATLRSRS